MIFLVFPSRSTVSAILSPGCAALTALITSSIPEIFFAVDLCDHVAAEPELRPFDRRRGVAALEARLVGRAAP